MSDVQRVIDIISDRTSADPISSKEISRILGIKDADAQPKTRAIITKALVQREVPIGANSEGFFIIGEEDELVAYLMSLRNRSNEINNRVEAAITAYYKTRQPVQERLVPGGRP